MSAITPKITLIAFTPDPEQVVAEAARTCYSPDDSRTIHKQMTTDKTAAMIKQVKSSGHLSVLEHASFTFSIEGVSRALLAQITRHRLASFSVQSQRYVNQTSNDGFDYIIPPSIMALGNDKASKYKAQMSQIDDWYKAWLVELGGNKEDARMVLPNAAATTMVVTMNARELLHFFELRCCDRSQWEIRTVAWEMLRLVREIAPTIFDNAGPRCMRGSCPEGKRTCGKPKKGNGSEKKLK